MRGGQGKKEGDEGMGEVKRGGRRESRPRENREGGKRGKFCACEYI